MARTKTETLAFPVGDDAEADRAVRRIGQLENEIALGDARLRLESARLKATHERLTLRRTRELAERRKGLKAYCESNRARLTGNGKTKSVTFPAGTVGWRLTPFSIAIKGKAAVIARIKKGGDLLAAFLRQPDPEIDKEAMLKDSVSRKLARSIEGVTVKQKEEFFIKPAGMELANGGKPS